MSDLLTLTQHPDAAAAVEAADRPGYLLIIERQGARCAALPVLGGELILGRGEEAGVRLEDRAASRRHARLWRDGGGVYVADLQSHNGTRVNGERLLGPRQLAGGDVIGICDASVVLQQPDAAPRRPVLEGAALRRRLWEEVERSARFCRPLTLLCLVLGAGADAAGVLGRLQGSLGPLDLLGRDRPGELWVVLPECPPGEAAERARRLLRELLPAAPQLRGGLGHCPEDGDAAEALCGAARAAAAAAAAGQLCQSADAVRSFRHGEREVLVADPAMLRIYELIERLAPSELPVLILGETGTGKELAAGALHGWSGRAGRMVALSCAALPEQLAEGELFGYERGAFSGASAAKPGLLELAHGGTVFLDEVGELSLALQAKLLRVLESKVVSRLGSVREQRVDMRLVAATNRNLEQEIRAGRFRQDLYFRLSAATVLLPPLRERRREVALLARSFLQAACARAGRAAPVLSADCLGVLLRHRWPGNLRELRNTMDYVAATCTEEEAGPLHLPEGLFQDPPEEAPAGAEAAAPEEVPAEAARRFRPIDEELRELERRRMVEALRAAGGVQVRAAELIAMPVRTFSHKMKQYGISAKG